jgi:hypothetical protein
VTVSWVLHAISLNEIVAVVHLNFEQVVKRFFIFLVVTATDQIELTSWSIHALEVVWKLMLILHLHLLATLIQKVELENYSRIFLKQMDHGAGWSWIIVGSPASKHGLGDAHWLIDIQVG